MIAVALAAVLGLGGPVDETSRYPEGPLYAGGGLYVAEMAADSVYRYQGAAKRAFFTQAGCGPTAIAPYGGGFVVLCHLAKGLTVVDGEGRPLRRISGAVNGPAFQDPNDCSADDRGGVYFSDPGVFSTSAPPSGRIWRLDADGAVQVLASGLHYPNGVFFDAPRRRLLVSEHLSRRVLAYPVQNDGALGKAVVLADIDAIAGRSGSYREAGPDGLEIGPDGVLYVALYGEGRVLRLTPQGRLLGEIVTPFAYVTNVAFAPTGRRGVAVGAYVNDRPPFPGAVFGLQEGPP
ncbi:MAG: SMP-30/gluconolactonase/LRE family protein [Hyphomonadaceae bacterium]|nr:SMP-30/gluconolactonase/LRE family protein [Hyphomonadaceae bacterium]